MLTWTASVAACGPLGWLINHSLLVAAIELSDPATRARDLLGSKESVTSDLLELSLAVSLTLIVAINAVLMALALPSVVLCRRYLMRSQLVAEARIDAKTGLLNAGTWQREASAELNRAVHCGVPLGAPLVLALVGVDHFKSVIETVGPLVGDQLLRDIAGMLKEQLPEHDLIGRFGGDEFAILLPQDRSRAGATAERAPAGSHCGRGDRDRVRRSGGLRLPANGLHRGRRAERVTARAHGTDRRCGHRAGASEEHRMEQGLRHLRWRYRSRQRRR